ncbi:hypothetical protein [Flavobacterium sp.]|jgi:hypothetical protein|uniref:hypothetical protein n=1 Tax=Flavobacterium sp. TaxID=239 RepID=UPI0022C43BD4|nr:hypothetical protein [Flavobacterium sp.]MCZ8169235.1 hypothetical protein [Flavobacterium sp.]MCZ8297527.1 hypothetical protein [Flavobacterium sp.]
MQNHFIKLTTTLFFWLIVILCADNQNTQKTTSNDEYILTAKEYYVKNESCKGKIDNIQNELESFVPKDYSILDTLSGDLNLDNIKDYILVLKKKGEETSSNVIDSPARRPLLLLLRDVNNKLQLARKNNNTVFCVDCGGMMGDPYMGLTIKNGYFSVEHYGGSAWRWTRIITFKYSKKENEWFLHKDGSQSFHATEPEKVESTMKTRKDIGRIKFEDFDIYKDDEK